MQSSRKCLNMTSSNGNIFRVTGHLCEEFTGPRNRIQIWPSCCFFVPSAARSSLRWNEKAARGSDLNQTTVPGEFPTQRPVTRSYDVFFDLHPNKRLSKQWRGWWFETLSCPLWRQSLKHPNDPGDKARCFTKFVSDVMEKNAPVKSKVIKKPQIPYEF